MADSPGLRVVKLWNGERGRMTLVAVNDRHAEASGVIVEDRYPPAISGMLCFGGIGMGAGFDSWGWGGLGQGGLAAAGACAHGRHPRGMVWSFGQPLPL